jgi:hypothetical protein
MRSGLGFLHDHRIAVRVGVLLLLALNVVLVLAVLRRPDPAAAPSAASTEAGLLPDASERWLVAVQPPPADETVPNPDDALAVRARSGTCTTGGATVERSGDGGRTWVNVTEQLRNLVLIRRVLVDDPSTARIVGPRTDCESDVWASDDGGLTWTWNGDDSGIWFRRGEANRAVHAPVGSVQGPCAARATARDVTDDGQGNGIVLCSDGTVARSRGEDGATWDALGELPDAWGVSFTGDTGYAVAKGADCFGAQVLSWDGARWNPLSCVPDAGVTGAAITVRGQLGLLVGFSGTWRSVDGGVTWTPVP